MEKVEIMLKSNVKYRKNEKINTAKNSKQRKNV